MSNKSFADQNDFVNHVQSVARTKSNDETELTVLFYLGNHKVPLDQFCNVGERVIGEVHYSPPRKSVDVVAAMSLQMIQSLVKENEELKAKLKEQTKQPTK